MIPVLSVALIMACAAIPYGGVATWAHTTVGILCYAAAIAGSLTTQPARVKLRRSYPSFGAASVGTLLLLAWIGLHAALRHHGFLTVPEGGYSTSLLSAIFIWTAFGALGWWTSHACAHRRALKTLAGAIITLATLEALLSIAALYTDLGPYSLFVTGARAAGTFSSGNSLGGFLALSLVFSLGATFVVATKAIAHIRRRGSHILHVATREDYIVVAAVALCTSCLAQVAALLLSGSRGAITSAAVMCLALLVWFYLHARRQSASRPILAFVLALLAITIILGGGGAFGIATGRLQELTSPNDAALPRLLIWRGAWDLAREYPLGTGLGTFPKIFPSFQPAGYGVNRIYHAHSDYLELLIELGIPGVLLLGLVLWALLATAVKRVRNQKHVGTSAWLRRSALLAVGASLLHAAVDFNLSSRPGVTVLAAILLGMALSQSRRSATRPRAHRLSRFTMPAVLLAVALPVTVHQVRSAAASVLARQGFSALGGSPSPYFFLPLPTLAPDEALARMERAASLAPANPWTHVMLARGRQLRHDIRRKALASANSTPDIPANVINMQLAVAMRPEERAMLQRARDDLQTALEVAPDAVDASAQMALVIGRLAHLESTHASYRQAVADLLAQAEHTRLIGPHDVTANRLIYRGLVHAIQSSFADRSPNERQQLQACIRTQGVALIRLSPSPIPLVLDGFRYAEIEPSSILNEDGLPTDSIWTIYQHYNGLDRTKEALAALNALANAAGSASSSRSTLRTDRERLSKERYRHLALRERCRWLLRTQQFSAYAALKSDRDAMLSDFVSSQLDRCRGDSARLQTLSRLWDDRGLDAPHTDEYLCLVRNRGFTNSRYAAIASRTALFGSPSPELTEAISRSDASIYAPRLTLLRAKAQIASGRFKEARTQLLSLSESQPGDPDVPALMLAHAEDLGLTRADHTNLLRGITAVSPTHPIGMQFLGGRVELTGLSIAPNKATTYWRFRSPVPSDLQAVVFLRDATPTTHLWRVIDFTKAGGLDFGSGMPKLGKVFMIETPLSHKKVTTCSRLCVGLRRKSTNRWLLSSERLPFCEIDRWLDLARSRHLFRDQVAPSKGIRKMFAIDKLYRRPRFSHNVGHIFDHAEYHPLLGGQRKTTNPPTWQPCLAASGLVERAVAAAREAFDADPYVTMFPLGINDGQDWCECDECRDLCPQEEQDEPASNRWWSEPYWTFVNDVAKQVQETHPDRRIGAIAYSNVARPPSFTLEDNITVYVCQDAGAHFDVNDRERDIARLKDWSTVCSDAGLYGYAGLASWIFPRYCRDELADSIRTASELGVRKYYIEDSWVEWLDGPLPWIVKELIEEPNADPKVLQRQFCNAAYGPAAEVMDTYFNYLQKVWQSASHGRWFDGLFRIDQQARRYPPSVRQEMYGFIKDAKGLAKDIPAVLRRIQAVAGPLEVAEAFAVEYDLMRALAQPIEDQEGLLAAEKDLEALHQAVENRNAVIESLDDQPWGATVGRALRASRVESTLDRWNRRQAALVNDVNRTVTVIRNVLGDFTVTETASTDKEGDESD